MNGATRTWAVVLAAGEGTRLASLTRDASGNAVPKQFCSLNDGPSLVQEAIERARQVQAAFAADVTAQPTLTLEGAKRAVAAQSPMRALTARLARLLRP